MPFNMQAALGLAQFERLDELVKVKRKHFEYYKNSLSGLDLEFNYEPENVFNSAWITGMVLGKSYKLNKTTFIKKLQQEGIPSRPFFYPLSKIPAYNQESEYKHINPTAYDISNRGVNLPGAMNLTSEQLELVCTSIKRCLHES